MPHSRLQFLRAAAAVVLAALGVPGAVTASRSAPSPLPASGPVGLPVGYIEACAAPYVHYPGWLPCDGRVIDPAEYPALAAVLAGTFRHCYGRNRLPDLRGRTHASHGWAIKT